MNVIDRSHILSSVISIGCIINDSSYILSSVISTDGICAWWLNRVVRYYVRQKWRNLKAPAKSYPADFARNGMSQLEPFPLLLWDFSTFVQQSAGNPDRDILYESRRSKWRGRYASIGLNAIGILIDDRMVCDTRVIAVAWFIMIAGYSVASFRPMGFVLGDDTE